MPFFQRPNIISDAVFDPVVISGKPLKTYFNERGLKFGVQFEADRTSLWGVNSPPVAPNTTHYRAIQSWVKYHCDIYIDGNWIAWSRIEPSSGSYDYDLGDKHFNAMQAMGLECVHGGFLVVDAPAWTNGFTQAQMKAAIEDRCQRMINRYTGIKHWTVVNEVIQPNSWGDGLPLPSPNNVTGATAMRPWNTRTIAGADWVEWAFKAAQTATATTSQHTLVFQDHTQALIANPDFMSNTLNFLDYLINTKGCRIDEYSYQAHMNPNGWNMGGWSLSNATAAGNKLAEFLNLVAQRVPRVTICEFDMTCIDLPFAEVPQKAADWAQAFLTPVFRDVSALKHFICWSTDDGKSWLNQYAPRTDDNPITGSNLMNSLYQWNPLKDGILNALSARPLV